MKKLEPKTIIDYFVDNCMGSKGFRFNSLSKFTRFIESNQVNFLGC